MSMDIFIQLYGINCVCYVQIYGTFMQIVNLQAPRVEKYPISKYPANLKLVDQKKGPNLHHILSSSTLNIKDIHKIQKVPKSTI